MLKTLDEIKRYENFLKTKKTKDKFIEMTLYLSKYIKNNENEIIKIINKNKISLNKKTAFLINFTKKFQEFENEFDFFNCNIESYLSILKRIIFYNFQEKNYKYNCYFENEIKEINFLDLEDIEKYEDLIFKKKEKINFKEELINIKLFTLLKTKKLEKYNWYFSENYYNFEKEIYNLNFLFKLNDKNTITIRINDDKFFKINYNELFL